MKVYYSNICNQVLRYVAQRMRTRWSRASILARNDDVLLMCYTLKVNDNHLTLIRSITAGLSGTVSPMAITRPSYPLLTNLILSRGNPANDKSGTRSNVNTTIPRATRNILTQQRRRRVSDFLTGHWDNLHCRALCSDQNVPLAAFI